MSEIQHVSFPSIEQYRNVMKLVRERAQHDGLVRGTVNGVKDQTKVISDHNLRLG